MSPTTTLVLTVTGSDRPGLIRDIAQEIAAVNGNWLESRMAGLAGQFAGIVLASVPSAEADALSARLRSLDARGLRLAVAPGVEPPDDALDRELRLELLGQDHPGIVRDITRVLAEQRISVEELETDTTSGSFSGETMFKATARLRIPAALATATLRAALESLANELMVDIALADDEAG